MCVRSDSDECQNLLGVKGVVPLLFMLAEYLAKEAGHVIQITNVLEHARVPIIKVVFTPEALQCDITINIACGLLNSSLIKAFFEYDGSFKVYRFIYLVKAFAKSHRINEAADGYLSSYCWVCLGLHFLIKHKYSPPVAVVSVPATASEVNPSYCNGLSLSYRLDTSEEMRRACSANLKHVSLLSLLKRFLDYFLCFDVFAHVVTLRDDGIMVMSDS